LRRSKSVSFATPTWPISDALDQMLDPDPQRRMGALEKLIDVAHPFASGFDTPAEGTLE